MKTKLLLIGLLAITACSSPKPKPGVENAGHEAVIASLNNESIPSWAEKASIRPFYEDGDDVVAVGFSNLNGDARTDAGFKISDLNAKATLSKNIQSRIEHFSQVSEEGVSFEGLNLQSITSEVSKLNLSNSKPGRRYFQRVAVTQDNGTVKTELRFWSEVKLSKEDLKRNIIDVAKESKGDKKLSKEFNAVVQKHFESIVSGDQAQPTKEANE